MNNETLDTSDEAIAAERILERMETSAAASDPQVALPEPENPPIAADTQSGISPEQVQALEQARQDLMVVQDSLQNEYQEIQDLRYADKGEFAARLVEWQAKVKNYEGQQAYFNQVLAHLQSVERQEQDKLVAQEMASLKAKIPDWNSHKEQALVNYLKKQGYTQRQIDSVTDHRLVVAFWEQYQRTLKPKVIPASARKKFKPKPEAQGIKPTSTVHSVQRAAERIRAAMDAGRRI